MNASTEKSALHLILVTFVYNDPIARIKTERAVRATIERAGRMGILDLGGSSELNLPYNTDRPKSELMDFYLDECEKKT